MPLTATLEGAANSPFTMIWSLFVSLLASIVARSAVRGQEPTGRKFTCILPLYALNTEWFRY